MRDQMPLGSQFSVNDHQLINEAVRRASSSRFNGGATRDEIVAAVMAEAGRGTRNMFGLVKAGARARPSR